MNLTPYYADLLISEQGKNVVIPDTFTSIGHPGSYGGGPFLNSGLESVVIPDTVTRIGKEAFAINNLQSVKIPDSVEFIDSSAFQQNNLTSVDLGEGVATINAYAFGYNNLRCIDIPESVEYIHRTAFVANPIYSTTQSVGILANIMKGNKVPKSLLKAACTDSSDLDQSPTGIEESEVLLPGNGGDITIDSLSELTPSEKRTEIKLSEPIQVGEEEASFLFLGSSKKDKINGSIYDDILAGAGGKNVLKGREGSDGFLFNDPNGFGRKKADKIMDFSSQDDQLLLDAEVFGLRGKITYRYAPKGLNAKKASKLDEEFIYQEKGGLLYFNENGKEKGFGDGGLLCKLVGAPYLSLSDFVIV